MQQHIETEIKNGSQYWKLCNNNHITLPIFITPSMYLWVEHMSPATNYKPLLKIMNRAIIRNTSDTSI